MSGANIHPMSIVHPEAKVHESVQVGPFCQIGPHVEIGENCVLKSHVVIEGHSKIGRNNSFFQFSSIGAVPQDMTYNGEPTQVIIGDNNTFREYVSIHRGTLKQEGKTVVGDGSLFMAYVHFGHDVTIGSKVVIANSVNLAGHVKIGDGAIIGGASSVSQFVTVGNGAYIGGGSALDRDVPHFCTAYGNRIRLKGVNIIGLKRQGHDKGHISELVEFYRSMESSALSTRAFIEHDEFMEDYRQNPLIEKQCLFIRESQIGIAPFMS